MISKRWNIHLLGSRLWFQAACAVLIAAPFIFTLSQVSYLPGTDETYQLEAAVNLALGRGYVATREIGGDLSLPSFNYLTAWPRGYSLLVAALIKAGASLSIAAKLIKMMAIILAIYGWLNFARRFAANLTDAFWFCCFIGFFVVVCSESPTDLFVLGIFPLLLEFLLRIEIDHQVTNGGASQNHFNCLVAGTLVGVAVTFKYTAIPLVLVGLAWVTYTSRVNRKTLLCNISFFLMPAIFIIGSLFLANYQNAKSFSTITDIPIKGPILGWHTRWILESLTAFFVDAAYLPKIFIRDVLPYFLPGHEAAMRTIAALCILVVLVLASASLFRRGDPWQKLVTITLASYGSAALFLGTTASLFYYDSEWNPLQHGRYYQWAIPGVVLCILVAVSPQVSWFLEKRGKIFSATAITLPIAGFFALNVLFAMHIYRTTDLINTDAHLTDQTINSIRLAEGALALVVFADSDNFRAAQWKGQINIHFASASFPPGSYFSEKTLVAMLCSRSGPWELYSANNACQSLGFDDAAHRFKFNKELVGKRNTLYWRVFPKGPSPD